MPPVYSKLFVISELDNTVAHDLREQGINLIYIPNCVDSELASVMFADIVSEHVLHQHSYIGNFGRTITPHRLTYAIVPHGRRYRYKGKDFIPSEPSLLREILNTTTELLPDEIIVNPDSMIVNGYRYNNDDYIALHTDDEKFLQKNNCSYWSDSTVCTITLLRTGDMHGMTGDMSAKPMRYNFGNPDTGKGFSLRPLHGSLIIQGRVLHEVLPEPRSKSPTDISRISITLRKVQDTCPHGSKCTKITCPVNLGPSNYVYYSNFGLRMT